MALFTLKTTLAISLSVATLATSGLALSATTTLPNSALIGSNNYYTDTLGTQVMTPNDDLSSALQTFGFTFNLFGQSYNSFYVNNNGNITFNSTYSTFTPQGPTGVNTAIVSPFFADVDTRGAGAVYLNKSADQVVITWDNVGYYNTHSDKIDSFQLVIRSENYAKPAGEGTIGFFYKGMAWETGDASSGSGGFGGSPAAVGFGDGLGNSTVLAASQANGVSGVLENHHIWFNVDNGGGVVVVPTPAPEPDTFAMLAAGLGLIGVVARRRTA